MDQQPTEPFLHFILDETWTDAQQEALVELMVWAMYVDKSIRSEENELIDQILDQMSVGDSTPIAQYLNPAIAKVRESFHHEQKSAFLLEDICLYLDDADVRAQAFDLCSQILEADGHLHKDEVAFLERIKTRFMQ
ncbi:MAG TPA: TerB family tellurite resistance protein [Rhodothermales bacterium]|nr:TerB family tellurite resistance protein [Rhodothermales bacterium]